MEPKYSVLLCNQKLSEYTAKIREWLMNGVKVFWFGNKTDSELLRSDYKEFTKVFLLQVFEIDAKDQCIIVDGNYDEHVFKSISENCRAFNAAQYQVEHCRSDENIVVQASAGTGKTFVMIDRIMYLIHMVKDLHLSEIFMITFTNEAAEQMCSRLQDVLMTRYRLTHKQKYLRWVEEQSQMHISTIHSFAFFLIREYGINEGFTRGTSIRSLEFERKELIRNTVDSVIDENKSLVSQMGIPLYRTNALVSTYWSKISQLGVSYDELKELEWGEADNGNSAGLHNKLSEVILKTDEDFFEIKRKENALTISDMIRDLEKVLTSDSTVLPDADISMKYLFIDEFQDSDMAQIRVACILAKLHKLSLFVVGDVKQSIYRFRGATDKAFSMLDHYVSETGISKPKKFSLVNNYRTAAGVLDRLNDYFNVWGQMGLLKYDSPVRAFNSECGNVRMIRAGQQDELDSQIAEIVSEELNKLIDAVENNEKKADTKTRIAILTRSNKELNKLAYILERNKIPASVQRDGSFYESDAVRDFYMMVCSFMFSDEPKYMFNYLMSPYAGEIDPLDINHMEFLDADYENLVDYLNHFVEQTTWKKYHKMLRLRPVMSVFKKMLDEISVTENYVSLLKTRRMAEGWQERRIWADSITRSRKYQANLEKLMEILQNQFSNDKVSLYDVYNFLKLNISTNRSENEAVVETYDDYKS